MEKYLVNSFQSFFNARKQLGYISDCKVKSLLAMNFIYRLIFFDYRGIIRESDYNIIEKAINCLYGRNCLLPYRDYLKMGKLKIGEYTELAHKLCSLRASNDSIAEKVSVLDAATTSIQSTTQDLDSRVSKLENT